MVTTRTPWGSGEEFIIPEILELSRQGFEVTIFPLRPSRRLAPGAEAAEAAQWTVHAPLFSLAVILSALGRFLTHPVSVGGIIWRLLRHSGDITKLLKNLAVLPKGLLIGAWIARLKTNHLHAHWASTSATAAYIATATSGIPWSFTAHRWDITEKNMLAEKARTAAFIRVISGMGANEMRASLPGELTPKLRLIHMGVILPEIAARTVQKGKSAGILCVANMILVKGHKYLIEACTLLEKKESPCIVGLSARVRWRHCSRNKWSPATWGPQSSLPVSCRTMNYWLCTGKPKSP